MIYEYECLLCADTKTRVCSVREHVVTDTCHCGGIMVQIISAAMVSPDITPYRAVAGDRAGEMITSRREHREFLKRNRFVEVGNEPIKPIRNDFRPKKGDIARELKNVIPRFMK